MYILNWRISRAHQTSSNISLLVAPCANHSGSLANDRLTQNWALDEEKRTERLENIHVLTTSMLSLVIVNQDIQQSRQILDLNIWTENLKRQSSPLRILKSVTTCTYSLQDKRAYVMQSCELRSSDFITIKHGEESNDRERCRVKGEARRHVTHSSDHGELWWSVDSVCPLLPPRAPGNFIR